jgi:hypothetical protein
MRRSGLVRLLALEKLRELRRAGLSYRGIGRRYGAPVSAGAQAMGSLRNRVAPDRLQRIEPATEKRRKYGSHPCISMEGEVVPVHAGPLLPFL